MGVRGREQEGGYRRRCGNEDGKCHKEAGWRPATPARGCGRRTGRRSEAEPQQPLPVVNAHTKYVYAIFGVDGGSGLCLLSPPHARGLPPLGSRLSTSAGAHQLSA